jgi:hypothetical protein
MMKAKQCASPCTIELLESRIAPASLTLTDINGDLVKFTSSSRSHSATFSVTPTASGDGSHNKFAVDLSAAAFDGTNFSVTVTKGPHGDGVADIFINAGTNNLGIVNVAGDLESITAGGHNPAVSAVKSLTVNSMGRFEGIDGALQTSILDGPVGALAVKGNVYGSFLLCTYDVGSVSIGGSLLGGTGNGNAEDGEIFGGNSIGKVSIKGDVRGGAGQDSAVISAGTLGSISVGGSIYGGGGAESGTIYSDNSLGDVSVGGSVFGGSNDRSGSIGAIYNVTSVSIGGSVHGGSGNGSGTVFGGLGPGATIGKIIVGGSVIGGSGEDSGLLGTTYQPGPGGTVNLTKVVIGKDIVGGTGDASGGVFAFKGEIGTLTLKGSIVGGDSSQGESGFVQSDLQAGSYSIGGSLYGGGLGESGSLDLNAGISSIKIGGSIYGAAGFMSASINCTGTIGLLNIRGDVLGGSGSESGRVTANSVIKEIIGGIVLPGSGTDSGTIP